MYTQPIQKIVIDGCAVPVMDYSQAREAAVSSGHVQFIGVLYDAPPAPPAADNFSLLAMFRPHSLFSDLRQGNHLRYLMGCTYEELKTCRCAVIIHVYPHAEEVPRA